ncbi:3-hydroxyisobutyrate dehydrogenase, partial [Azospirillum brasilense]|uniref:NAD(P)-binding domain-containing protein n=1 Tax=Azospirillum brasilense TaxID=192 RepID=UPI00190B221A
MATIAFIGLGNMGAPMMRNLLKAGHTVLAFDLSEAACTAARDAGATIATGPGAAAGEAEVVVTMLPAGKHVREVYTAPDGIIAKAKPGSLFIDSSTVDVESARAVAAAAEAAGHAMVDAPVSGGVGGAEAAAATLMVGGSEHPFLPAGPSLSALGKAIGHPGRAGNAHAAALFNPKNP